MNSPTRFLLALLVLVPFVCAMAVQTSDAPKADEQPPKKAEVKTVADEPYWICPVSSMFNHGTYVTYYAKRCNMGTFSTWDGPSPHALAAMNCCGMGTTAPTDVACESIDGKGLKVLHRHEPHARKDDGYEGGKQSHNPSPAMTIHKGSGEVISHYYVRYFRKNDASKVHPIYAQVFVMFYQVNDASTPSIFATGHEIKKPAGDPKFEVANDDVTILGNRCHELTIGDLKCTVMLHHASDDDPITP